MEEEFPAARMTGALYLGIDAVGSFASGFKKTDSYQQWHNKQSWHLGQTLLGGTDGVGDGEFVSSKSEGVGRRKFYLRQELLNSPS